MNRILSFACLTVTLVLASVTLSSAQNATAVEPPFVREPTTRGTVGILSSAIISLAICVWTAVHIDILPKSLYGERFYYKLVWAIAAFVAPEILAAGAYRQYRKAQLLRRDWRRRHRGVQPQTEKPTHTQGGMDIQPTATPRTKNDPTPNGPYDDGEMDLQVAFFIVMGGCVALTDGHETPRTLTPDGFLYYAAKGEILEKDFNKRVIEDKSNADTVAKVIGCSQVLWMVVQCIGR